MPTARLLPIISPEEAAELTYYGSEVVHPFTMEQVIRRKIPIRIKNVENPLGGGTVIHPDLDADAVDVAKGKVEDGDLDEAGEGGGDDLSQEHCSWGYFHVVSEFEV